MSARIHPRDLLYRDRAVRDFGAVNELASAIDSAGGIWSLGARGSYCGLPLVPPATSGMGAKVLDVPAGVRCWGWTPPGELAAARRYGPAFIADVEFRGTNKVRPDAGWTGSELLEAADVAQGIGGVTSHGFVLHQLRGVLGRFAAAGCTAYPQVYDSDRSTEPRAFLRRCVGMYRAAGFTRVVPLLGVSAGVTHLLAWLDECRRMDLRPDLWQLARLQELAVCDNGHKREDPPPDPTTPEIEPAPAPPGQFKPAPFPRPEPLPVPISLSNSPDLSGLVLLLVAAGLLYSLRKS